MNVGQNLNKQIHNGIKDMNVGENLNKRIHIGRKDIVWKNLNTYRMEER